MSLPRVLLVEDDASIRRFVALALEDDGVELVQTASLAQAAQALQGDPFTLVLCDLTLPDGSGLDLLRALGQAADAATARHAAARRVAFSAGVSAPAAPAPDPPAAQAPHAQAVQAYFGGDQGLYDAYLAQCRPQFAHDADSGLAAQVEDCAARQQADTAWAQWPAPRARLQARAQAANESRA